MSSFRMQQLLDYHSGFFSSDEAIPLDIININVAKGCTLKCSICHAWKDKFLQLSAVSCKRFLKSILPFMKKHNVTLIYGGGEPLMNSEITEFIDLANEFEFINEPQLLTNGWLLTRSMAQKLVGSDLKIIVISLDSIDEEIHDRIRGMKGSYKRVIAGVKHLLEFKELMSKRTKIGFNTTINALNIEKIPDLVRWVNNNRDKFKHIRFQAVTHVFGAEHIDEWYNDNRYSFLWPKDAGIINKVYDELIFMKEKKYIIGNSVRHLNAQREYFLHPERQYKQSLCGFFKSIFVEANGDVFMCMKDKPIGNINDLDFDAGKFRRIIKAEQKKIMNCSVINCHFDLNCRFN